MAKPLTHMRIHPDKPCCRKADGPLVGIDEVGRGCLAGPVYAAAVVFHDVTAIPLGIRDSKKLTHERRETLYDQIFEAAHVGIGFATVAEIDEINIFHATMLAMRRAYGALPTRYAAVLVDGDRDPHLGSGVRVDPHPKADDFCPTVAAASIIAKVTRDRLITSLAEKDGDIYGWSTNKGYGTKTHMDGLARHGVNEHHRRSFDPVRRAIRGTGQKIVMTRP